MVGKITILLMTGGWGASEVEQAVAGAHRAASRDLLETLLPLPSVDRAVIATDDPGWTSRLSDLPVTVDVDPPDEAFHFGQRLVDLIERYDAERVLYVGGGSAPLLRADQWAEIMGRLGTAEQLVVTNNLHSCDWAGFTPGPRAVPFLAGQSNDNAIAWTLVNRGSFPVEALPASAASRFDMDTPIDLLIAERHPQIGPHLRRYVDGLGWDTMRLDAVVTEMRREGGNIIVAGRVPPAAWTALQRETRCWVRVFAEERGMRASGRQSRGEVRSLLNSFLDLVGTVDFFPVLGELSKGVLLDNRVILASRRLWPSPRDRFNSDLGEWEEVDEPFLRELSRAAAEAPVPVVMGGHTLVAGGLMALAESLGGSSRGAQESNQR